MKTLLYIGAGMDIDPILNYSEYDRFIYTIDRPFDNLNDHILDDFIKIIKKQGYSVKIKQISYNQPFYIKCSNDKKHIKYWFNIMVPTSSMLRYENISETKISLCTNYNANHIMEQLRFLLIL
jgi:hypothetical protein